MMRDRGEVTTAALIVGAVATALPALAGAIATHASSLNPEYLFWGIVASIVVATTAGVAAIRAVFRWQRARILAEVTRDAQLNRIEAKIDAVAAVNTRQNERLGHLDGLDQ